MTSQLEELLELRQKMAYYEEMLAMAKQVNSICSLKFLFLLGKNRD
jgi:hypothetical protein